MVAALTDRHLAVPHHAWGARLARQRLSADLAGVVGSDLLADAVAIAAELVGNAVRHARPLAGDVVRISWLLHLDRPQPTLEIRVEDGGSLADPRIRPVTPDAIDGRGLAIVAALAERWGTDQTGTGRVVWAVLVETRSDSC